MAKRAAKGPAPAVEPLAWDINHPGARQIWCAALTGFAARPGVNAAQAVDYANEVMADVIRRTENQHATERPMAKENPK